PVAHDTNVFGLGATGSGLPDPVLAPWQQCTGSEYRPRGTRKFGCNAALGWLLLFAATELAHAQVPLDLAAPKPFRALRIASTDPKYKNADYRRIAPGATLELGKIEGHGRITHMWFTIASKSDHHLQELVLRIYWDGADKPAVECPL